MSKLPVLFVVIVLLALLVPSVLAYQNPESHPQATRQSTAVALELVAEGFDAPINLLSPPDDTGRIFIVDQAGTIKILADGQLLETPFLDLRDTVMPLNPYQDEERGLLGLVFHPDYATNGRFFVFYNTEPETRRAFQANVLAEYQVSEDPNLADTASERILFKFDQSSRAHAGGQLLFGPDGYLYVGIGDEGESQSNPQDLESFHGKILRIDVNSDVEPYAIPADNPFVDADGLDEIYAYGFRHPWRLSLDPETSTIFISEPAWNLHHQELNVLQPGANYGWDVMASKFCYEGDATEPIANCLTGKNGEVLTAPVAEYAPEVGQIIVGAYLYRGSALPELNGKVVMAEWGYQIPTGAKLLTTAPQETGRWPIEQLEIATTFEEPIFFWGLGQDSEGELYLLTMGAYSPVPGDGKVYKIVPAD